MMRTYSSLALWVGCGAWLASCGGGRELPAGGEGVDASASPTAPLSAPTTSAPAAAARLDALRTRFVLRSTASVQRSPGQPPRANDDAPPAPTAVIGAGLVARFDELDETHVRPVVSQLARAGVRRSASVELPTHANAAIAVEDDVSHVAVRFSLTRANSAQLEVANGLALYRGALEGADVVHRVHAEGTEDFVVFEQRPAPEEIAYQVDVSRVAGLRLVSNTLEFLDASGTPQLRVAPPYVVDAGGDRHEARLAVEGCAYDADPRAPWGRGVTSAGAAECRVRVAWSGVEYPAIVDPSWTTTGSMATPRYNHTVSLLLSGRLLVAGGTASGGAALSSAEIFNPSASAGLGAFAATGSMTTARYYHSASVLTSGKVLIAAGVSGGTSSISSAELFDPAAGSGSGTFTLTGSLAAARSSHTSSVLNSGKILVVGGINAAGTRLSSSEIFDPAGNGGVGAFATTGSLATGRQVHTATVLGSGKVLIVGGNAPGYYLSSAELFDPAANSGVGAFTTTGSLSTPHCSHTATLLPSGKVLIAGGYVATLQSSAELFDPSANGGVGAFVVTGSMTIARAGHAASPLLTGLVLVAGGTTLSTSFSTAELFDPSASSGLGAFSATASMSVARQGHTATLLPSGSVLVVGGSDSSSTAFSSSELYAALKAAGVACAAAGECASGFCVDSVCCASACNTACQACSAAKKASGGGDGSCGSAAATTDPRALCATTASTGCGTTGACDGSGNCAKYVASTPCGTSCSSGSSTASTCDGSGACVAGAPSSCGFYACASATSCATSCSSDAQCASNAYCAGSACVVKLTAGSTCSLADACASGFCVDGVCCATACNTACQACSAAKKASGSSDGTCGAAAAAVDPRGLCATTASTSCATTGACDGAGSCAKFATATPCGTTCTGGSLTPLTCDGSGACRAGAASSCGLYVCADASTCATSCSTDAQCAATAHCAGTTCVAGAPDAGVDGGSDTGPADTGVADTGSADSTLPDTATAVDSASPDDTGGATDTAPSDTSAGSDSAAPDATVCTTVGVSCGDGMSCNDQLQCVPGVPMKTGCSCSMPGASEGSPAAPIVGLAGLALSVLAMRRRGGVRTRKTGDAHRAGGEIDR